MSIAIYHNPRCSTSRAVLALIREAGVEPVVVDYMQNPPTREQLLSLLLALDIPPRALLRTKESAYRELGLAGETVTDRQIIDAIIDHPQLMQRPIVVSETGVKLCRPPEIVRDLL